MLRWSIIFLVIALIAALPGFGGVAAVLVAATTDKALQEKVLKQFHQLRLLLSHMHFLEL